MTGSRKRPLSAGPYQQGVGVGDTATGPTPRLSTPTGAPEGTSESKSRGEWRVARERCWKVVDDGVGDENEALVVRPKRTRVGDSVMMSDALYTLWGASPMAGDSIQSELYDEWNFTSEHTAPGGAARMQQELGGVLKDNNLTRSRHTEVLRHYHRARDCRRVHEATARQRLRGLGVTVCELCPTVPSGGHRQIVCPVTEGDLFACTFETENLPLYFKVAFVKRETMTHETLREASLVGSPGTCEVEPCGFCLEVPATGDLVLSFSVPAESADVVLSFLAIKRTLAAVVRNAETLRAPAGPPSSAWVCAACGFARQAPLTPVNGRVATVPCLVCDYVEPVPRKAEDPTEHCTSGPPGVPAGDFPSLFQVPDVSGTIFSVHPSNPLVNRTRRNDDGYLSVDFFDRLLPPLPPLKGNG